MKDIRIGNDISVRWSLYKGDEAYDLTNLPVTLYLKNAYGKKEIKDYTIEGNQISWTFFGKDQKNTGKYSMVLVVREGEQGMASTDYCDFVQLVSCACQVSGVDDENVQTETIELTSEVDFLPIIVDTALSESSLNAIANKAVAEKFAEVEGKMALQPDWNQSDPISKDYIKNRTHGIVFHGDPRKSNYNDFLKSLTNPMIMHVGGNTIATFHTGYHSLYDYDTFLFQLNWGGTTDNVLDGIIPTNRSVSVGASTSVALNFRTLGSVTEDGELVEHYQTTITFNDSEGWNVDEVISALCEQYCLLINEDFEIAKLDQRYIPETIARKSELTELSQEKEDKTNKVTSLTEESTDEQYPSAKVVYTLKERIEENELMIGDLFDTKIDKEADDYYPQLSVGLADNLSGVDVVDSEINFRRSGGGAISDGVARIETIKGNSVVWNQLFTLQYATLTAHGVKVSKNADNSLTCVGTLTDTYFNFGQFQSNIENHKYLFILDASVALDGYSFGLLNRNAHMKISGGFAYVFHTNSDISKGKYIGIRGLSVGNEINENLFVLQIDLTKAFPNDWQNINTIEEFYSRIPMGVDLNAYNEGEVIHMDVQSIESQGVNAWDGTIYDGYVNDSNGEFATRATRKRTGYIKILPNASYYIKSDQTSARWGAWYDKNKNYVGKIIAYGQVISPSNAEYCALTIYNNGDGNPDTFGINISDTSINGKYFPYIKRVEDLSIIRKYFPDGMKSVGSAHDEIRYNKATNRWEYSKGRIKNVDMGTLNWKNLDASNGMFYLNAQEIAALNMATHDNENIPTNLISSLYASAPTYDIVNIDKVFRGPFTTKFSGYLTIKDTSYTDAATFKAAMAGVMLYYEAADWEWVELDAEDQFKDLDYQVWNCGTEKAIAEGKSAPLAADITYGFNAIGKIKELESLVAALRAKVGI